MVKITMGVILKVFSKIIILLTLTANQRVIFEQN